MYRQLYLLNIRLPALKQISHKPYDMCGVTVSSHIPRTLQLRGANKTEGEPPGLKADRVVIQSSAASESAQWRIIELLPQTAGDQVL